MYDLLTPIIENSEKYLTNLPKYERKAIGQFFTSRETARFMASLFRIEPTHNHVSVLDAGAGSGILSGAMIEKFQTHSDVIKHIHLVCYENDEKVVELLQANLEYLQQHSIIDMSFELRKDNYITSQSSDYNHSLFFNTSREQYDFVIGNPPYLKVAKNAPEAQAMPDICYGTPNLYFLFAEMGLFNLNEDGEMVYIMPRSWTSGAYFTKFRKKFLTDGKITQIHIFNSRTDVFETDSVLQETIIISVKKTKVVPEFITITSTNGNHDFSNMNTYYAPYNDVVFGKDNYVFIFANDNDKETVSLLNKFNYTLPDIGLKMKTGLTVDFRCRELLCDTKLENTVPLFYSQHIKNGRVVFPALKPGEYIKTTQKSLLQDNTNLLFIKRFTSKEERRRLQPAIYLADEFNEYSYISTQNKINFITGNKILKPEQVYGLYVLFNSKLYDDYYRILNGSTQVNSTEINAIPVPSLNIIEKMGNELMAQQSLTETTCNNIMERYI